MVSPKIFFRRFIYIDNDNVDTLKANILYEIGETYNINNCVYDASNHILTIELIDCENTPTSEFYSILNKAFNKFVFNAHIKDQISNSLLVFDNQAECQEYKNCIEEIISGSTYLLYSAIKRGNILQILI